VVKNQKEGKLKMSRKVMGKPRERYSTEAFEDSVRIPIEQYQTAGVQSVPSRTMDGLQSQGVLVQITNANGQKQWVVIYPDHRSG
jgi:hypothetical protein